MSDPGHGSRRHAEELRIEAELRAVRQAREVVAVAQAPVAQARCDAEWHRFAPTARVPPDLHQPLTAPRVIAT